MRNWATAAALWAFGCSIPDTLGLPCELDEHCDDGQFCDASMVCASGMAQPGTESGGTTMIPTTGGTMLPGTTGPVDPTTTPGSSSSGTGPTCGPAVGGCDKLDVLLVVDNSCSMEDEVDKLLPAFTNPEMLLGPFLDPHCSYQIGVAATDNVTNWQPLSCQVPGALSISGALAAGTPCFDDPHPPWVTEEDPLVRLGCFLAVGMCNDSNEAQMGTMFAAIGDELGQPGACNEGFLRDDAALLIVMVTDEDDDDDSMNPAENPTRFGSPGNPSQWFDDLMAIKDPENVGFVAVVASNEAECTWTPQSGNSDGMGAEFATRILTFTQFFTGFGLGDHTGTINICAESAELLEEFNDIASVLERVCADTTL